MREKRSHVLRLALSMMVIALTNLPSTIVCGSALIFLSIIVSFRDKTVRPFLTVVGANVLAALWAAFFLLPAALQRQWVLSGEATSGQWDYAIHFPTATLTHFFEHNFYRETHLVVIIYVAVLLIVGIASTLRTNVQRPRFVVEFWITSAVSALLMFSLSAKFYSLVRIMKYIQFPWRYLLVLSTTLAVVTSSLASLRRARYTILVVASLLALGWYAFWPPQFFHDRTAIWDESFNIRTREIPGIREYMPSTVPMGAVERNALEPPVVAVPKSPDTQFRITRWDTEDRRILFQVSQPSVLLVRIIDFPGWNATINGAPAQTSVDASSGLIRVPVDGTGLLQLRFTRRASSTVGAAISVLSIFLALLWRRRFATGLQHPH